MRRLLVDMIKRPATALVSSIDMLGHRIQGMQTIDGVVSRIAHILNRVSNEVRDRASHRTTDTEGADGEARHPALKNDRSPTVSDASDHRFRSWNSAGHGDDVAGGDQG